MHVGISAGGVYRTDDGGRTWRARNRGIRVTFMPERFPEFGQCVHKIVRHPERPDRLFLQNHWGLYRSDDGADTWNDIAQGLSSDFGFAMATHPHDPDCVYIVPMESDEFRCTPEGRLRVYRTRSAGASWEPLTRGLPQHGAYETVLRDAMVTDSLDPVGICLAGAVVAELGDPSAPRSAKKRRRASSKTAKGSVGQRKANRSSRQRRRKRADEGLFWIPGALMPMTGGQSQVVVETSGGTLQNALNALFMTHPGIQDRLLTERGEIREHINVFVGNSIAQRQADWRRRWRTARKSRSFRPSAADKFLEVKLALHSIGRRSGRRNLCESPDDRLRPGNASQPSFACLFH